ncbi:MAG: alkaline phosphatase D family protein [Bryobacteraceae bacterium]
MKRRNLIKTIASVPVLPAVAAAASPDRPWLGPEYWANPLQDWRLRDGRFECFVSGGDRNVFWLTRELGPSGDFTMSVRLGRLDSARAQGWAGFRMGVKTWFGEWKDAAVRGFGLNAGLTADGELFIGKPANGPKIDASDANLELRLTGNRLTLTAAGQSVERDLPPAERSWLQGGLALVCSSGAIPETPQPLTEPEFATAPKPGTNRGGNLRFWFRDWKIAGARVVNHPERSWGPVLFNQYTLSRGVMKMTVQLAPIADNEWAPVELVVRGKTIATADVDRFAATATFRVPSWNDKADTPYEVRMGTHRLTGTIRRDPVNKAKLVVGSLTCQNDFGFPHAEVARSLEASKPDILFFTGDQVYERNGEYGIQRSPVDTARLDYLRKWYLFGWAWGHFTRDIPCVCLADDHDVYHGNIWGASGRKAEYADAEHKDQQSAQDSGGYSMDARWVNMVQRTQSSHLPDPNDPAPVDQGISVYFCELRWGGVSFAVIEDRKFKSAPKVLMPEAKIRNGWIQNPAFDSAKQGDVAGAQLLGDRQERFLANWARDWSNGVWMKVAVSQTILANLATMPNWTTDDSPTPKLPVEPMGGYAKDEKKVQDHDSNGWPQTPRNRAVRLLRSCLAVHLAGDQHLGSLIQYGADEFNDGSWALCAPAISNLWPRRWFPVEEGANRKPGSPRYTGEHLDGFGNKVTVHAVANPHQFGIKPAALHERACGFSVVELDRATRRIAMVNWPRWEDVSKPGAKAYPGWPVTIEQADNGLTGAKHALRLKKKARGVVEVTEAASGAHVWTWRVPAPMDRLPVWRPGRYRVKHEGGEETVDATA